MSVNEMQDDIHSHDGEFDDTSVETPPVVTRTRSGRRVRTPAALLDSEVTSLAKRPMRRRGSVIQEAAVTSETLNIAESETVNPATEQETLVTTEKFIISEPAPSTGTPVNRTSLDMGMRSDNSNEKENRVDLSVAMTLDTCARPNEGSKNRTSSESSVQHAVPLGKPKSGRVWKDRKKQRFSALLRDKPLRTSWEKKMEARREKELVKKYQLQLKEEKDREKQEKRKRREENLKRRAENERKAEVVQVIHNTAKIKRMKKKQLRKIEKRDTLPMIQKSK